MLYMVMQTVPSKERQETWRELELPALRFCASVHHSTRCSRMTRNNARNSFGRTLGFRSDADHYLLDIKCHQLRHLCKILL